MAEALDLKASLPVGSAGRKSLGWWGIWTLIATEGSLFGYLLLSYFYLYFQTQAQWPPGGAPELLMPGINTFILLASSAFVWGSERGIKRNASRLTSCGLMGAGIILGAAFIIVQLREWQHKSYGLTSHLYGSLYFTITGFHMAHVLAGLVILTLMLIWTALGYFNDKRHSVITIGALYWHFVDAVWLLIFSSLYLVPYLPVP